MLALYTIVHYSISTDDRNVIKRPYRLVVRTNPSQGLNRSSILRRVTNKKAREYSLYLLVTLEAGGLG